MIYESIVDTIGNTPIVKLHSVVPEHVEIYAKVEAFNPTHSVKSRLAWGIISDAERHGTISPGQTIIEATSGNTGIALAMVAAAKGYKFVAVMSDSFSVERRKIMRALGAKVILTPASEASTGMLKLVKKLVDKHGWFFSSQFENLAGPAYHRETTAPEILQDFAGRRLDYFVTGWGTGATLTGAGQLLKLARPNMTIVATEPENAQLLGRNEWSPHKIQGWTPNVIPGVLNPQVPDMIVPIAEHTSKMMARRLATEEGIFVGISAGGTLAAANQVAESVEPGSVMVVMLPDTGERYLSAYLCDDLDEGSDDEWLAELEGGSQEQLAVAG